MKSILLTISQLVLTLVLYVIGAIVMAVALIPAYLFWMFLHYCAMDLDHWWQMFWGLLGISGGYFIFGLSLMLLVGFIRSFLFIRLKEGEYKIGTPETLKWFFVNALFLSVRTVFMDFMQLTPFCAFFYRLMGAKLGRNVQINSKNVADHSLLEIGDNTVVGGNATVIGHIFETRGLRLMKVKIGKNVVIGLNSVIMPGVVIGDGAVVAAGAIVPKQTVVEPRTVYFSPDHQVKRD